MSATSTSSGSGSGSVPDHSNPAAAAAASSSSSSSATPLPPWCVPLTGAQCTYTAQYCEENAYKLTQQLLKRIETETKQEKTGPPKATTTPTPTPTPATPFPSPPASSLSLSTDESIYPTLASERVFVVFMSNVWNELRLHKQRIGDPARDGYVVWDYHVIVIVKPPMRTIQSSCICLANELAAESIQSPRTADDLIAAATGPTPCPCAGWVYDLDTTLPFPCPLDRYARASFRSHLAPPLVYTGDGESRRPYSRLFRVIGGRDFLLHFASDRRHMLVPPSILSTVIRSKSVEGVMRFDDGIASRKEIEQERSAQHAEEECWKQSPIKQRLDEINSACGPLSPSDSTPLEYLATPPPYPVIRSASSRHNLDEYRFFTQPDSGRGVVMAEREMIEFFHVNIPQPKINNNSTKAKSGVHKYRK